MYIYITQEREEVGAESNRETLKNKQQGRRGSSKLVDQRRKNNIKKN